VLCWKKPDSSEWFKLNHSPSNTPFQFQVTRNPVHEDLPEILSITPGYGMQGVSFLGLTIKFTKNGTMLYENVADNTFGVVEVVRAAIDMSGHFIALPIPPYYIINSTHFDPGSNVTRDPVTNVNLKCANGSCEMR
jgi:hypothetical protein